MNTKLPHSDSRHSEPLTTARERVLRFLYEHPGECELAPVHKHLGGHPNNARHLLAALETEGYVRSRSQAQGRGRPVKLYSLSSKGEAYCGQHVRSQAYEELLTLLLSRLSPIEAEQIGQLWAHTKSGVEAATMSELLAHLSQRGFAPESTSTGEILLNACPLVHFGETRSEPVRAMCELHSGYISALSAGEYHLLPFAHEGRCLLAREDH